MAHNDGQPMKCNDNDNKNSTTHVVFVPLCVVVVVVAIIIVIITIILLILVFDMLPMCKNNNNKNAHTLKIKTVDLNSIQQYIGGCIDFILNEKLWNFGENAMMASMSLYVYECVLVVLSEPVNFDSSSNGL